MTKHKMYVNQIMLYLNQEYPKTLRCWEIDTGQAFAKFSVFKALEILFKRKSPELARKELRTIFYGKKGHPDITGIINGRWFGIEVKIKNDSQNENQIKFQKMIEDKDGIYLLVDDKSPMEEQLKCLRQYS